MSFLAGLVTKFYIKYIFLEAICMSRYSFQYYVILWPLTIFWHEIASIWNPYPIIYRLTLITINSFRKMTICFWHIRFIFLKQNLSIHWENNLLKVSRSNQKFLPKTTRMMSKHGKCFYLNFKLAIDHVSYLHYTELVWCW